MASNDGYSVIVIGEGSVGKSALCIKFVKDQFSAEYNPTIEDNYSKEVTVDGKQVKLSLMDTAGQEEYIALREQYYSTGDAFLLVYSIDNPSSFLAIKNHRESIMATRQGQKNSIYYSWK